MKLTEKFGRNQIQAHPILWFDNWTRLGPLYQVLTEDFNFDEKRAENLSYFTEEG